MVDLDAIVSRLDTLLERSATQARFLTVDGSASYSSLSAKTIRRLVSSGKLTALRPVKGRIVIDRHEIDSYVLGANSRPRCGRGRQ